VVIANKCNTAGFIFIYVLILIKLVRTVINFIIVGLAKLRPYDVPVSSEKQQEVFIYDAFCSQMKNDVLRVWPNSYCDLALNDFLVPSLLGQTPR
jgi:hypothetical protein